MDDTLTCSGGATEAFGLAGLDVSYPTKTVYPGVLAFYRELDLGTSGSGVWDDTKVGNLVFLSARPHVYKDATEGRSYDKFQKLRKLGEHGLYTMPTLLAGALETGFRFAYGGNPEPLAVTKYKNLGEYLALYPEYKIIFIGDNGQGDVRAAEMALLNPNFAGNISRVYVHLVQPAGLTHRGSSIDDEECGAGKAAAPEPKAGAAASSGHEDKVRVARDRAQQLDAYAAYFKWTRGTPTASSEQTQGKDASAEDAASAERAERTFGVYKGALTPSRLAERRQRCENERERMCFFVTYADAAFDAHRRGLIRASGLRNVMAESAWDFGRISPQDWAEDELRIARLNIRQPQGQGAGAKIIPHASKPAAGASPASSQAAPGVSSVWACQGEAKRETRVRELNLSLQRGNEVLLAAGMTPVPLLPRKLTVGARCRTEFGLGVVTKVRRLLLPGAAPGYYGATYEVLCQWDGSGGALPARLFLQDWAVVSLLPVVLHPVATKYFRGAAKPAPVVLTSAVNAPSSSATALTQTTHAGRRSSFSGTPVATPTGGAAKFGTDIGMLTRENVAAVSTAKPLVPLYERGEGSVSSITSRSTKDQRESKAPTPEPPFVREEDVPPIDVVVQTSVFRPSVMDRMRAAPIYHRGRNRARSLSNVSSEDGTGHASSVGPDKAERDLSGMVGAQAWTPYGLVQVTGYLDDETRRDCIVCRMHGRLEGYVELFLQRACVVQLTDPAQTTCYQDLSYELLLDEPQVPPQDAPASTFESLSTPTEGHGGKQPVAKPIPLSRSSFVSSWLFPKTAAPMALESPECSPAEPRPEATISAASTLSMPPPSVSTAAHASPSISQHASVAACQLSPVIETNESPDPESNED